MKYFNRKKQRVGRWVAKMLHFLLLPWVMRKTSFPEKPKCILIFDFHLIGDIVLLSPLLIKLRQKNPSSHIALVAGPWAQLILESHPRLFNEFYPVTAPWVKYDYSLSNLFSLVKLLRILREREWDWGIDVRGDLRQILLLFLTGAQRRISYNFTGGGFLLTDVVPDNEKPKHLLDHNNQIFNYLYPGEKKGNFIPRLWLSKQEKEEVDHSRDKHIIGFHPGASIPLRRFPHQKSVELLQNLIKIPGSSIHVFQGPGEEEFINTLLTMLPDFLKKRIQVISVSLRLFIVELAKCDIFVGMDSGAAHIASALNVPVFVIFGPSDPIFCKPIGRSVHVIRRPNQEVSCYTCDQRHCIHSEYQFCMNTLSVVRIASQIKNGYWF